MTGRLSTSVRAGDTFLGMMHVTGEKSAKRVVVGSYMFDLEGQVLSKGGETLPLKRQSAAVLALLVENAGSVVTRTTIRDTVWHDRTIEFDDGINACVRDIRRALGDSSKNPTYIETIPKTGYRLKVDVAAPARERPFVPRRTLLIFTAALAIMIAAVFMSVFTPANNKGGERARIAVMPVTVPDDMVSARGMVDRLTDQMVGLLAERQTRVLVISIGELFADDELQPGMGDVSRWLSVDYLLAASLAGEDGVHSFTLRVIRTDGYVHLWSKTVAIEGDRLTATVEQLFTEMIASAREEDGRLLFADD